MAGLFKLARQTTFAVVLLLLWDSCNGAVIEQASLRSIQPSDATSSVNLNPYPSKPKITFKKDGTFKLTIFSDLHFGENPWDDWGPEQDINSTKEMKRILKDEKPDYVVLNGDLITGENTFKENSTKLIDRIVAPLNAARIPFSSSHGNHDNQPNITHLLEIEREQKVAPLSYTRAAPRGIGGLQGPGNYWVPVYTKATDKAPSLVLWFFDSRGGFQQNKPGVGVPDWVDESVVGWIHTETAAMNKVWGPADNRAALCFVHIPPHTIAAVQPSLDNTTDPGLNDDILGNGSTQASAGTDTGVEDNPFWTEIGSGKNIKNIHAVFSGHDHGNEWCVREPTQKVIFCFSKHSGYGGYSDDTWGHGVRNVVFSSPSPQDGIKTWIRLEEGETRGMVVLDQNYN